jgi:hypothetical protein
MIDDDDEEEPAGPASIESFCAALREVIAAARNAPPEEVRPDLGADLIETCERALTILESPYAGRNQPEQ